MDDARDVVAAYWAAAEARDWAGFAGLVAEQVVYEVPQTRERVRGRAAYIRFTAEGFPMAGDTMMYVSAASAHLDTVEVDSPIGAVFFDSPTQLANFRRRLDLVEQVALNPNKSRDLILSIAADL